MNRARGQAVNRAGGWAGGQGRRAGRGQGWRMGRGKSLRTGLEQGWRTGRRQGRTAGLDSRAVVGSGPRTAGIDTACSAVHPVGVALHTRVDACLCISIASLVALAQQYPFLSLVHRADRIKTCAKSCPVSPLRERGCIPQGPGWGHLARARSLSLFTRQQGPRSRPAECRLLRSAPLPRRAPPSLAFPRAPVRAFRLRLLARLVPCARLQLTHDESRCARDRCPNRTRRKAKEWRPVSTRC